MCTNAGLRASKLLTLGYIFKRSWIHYYSSSFTLEYSKTFKKNIKYESADYNNLAAKVLIRLCKYSKTACLEWGVISDRSLIRIDKDDESRSDHYTLVPVHCLWCVLPSVWICPEAFHGVNNAHAVDIISFGYCHLREPINVNGEHKKERLDTTNFTVFYVRVICPLFVF